MLEPQSDNKPTSVKTADDINDLFKEIDKEDDKKIPKEPKEDDKKTKTDEDEDKEIKEPSDEEEIELKEPDEDEEETLDLTKDDEEIEIDAPPRKQQLLKDYPDLFKKHPFLEKMLYRDKQYTELFGSFDDAKDLAERAEVFTQFEQQLLAGSTEEVLKNVKETDSKAFDKIVDNYLETLAKVDKDAYFDVVGNIGKRMIAEMVKEANTSNNEELKQAALLLNQFLFNSSNYVPPKQRVTDKPGDKDSEAEKERLSYVQERFETARDDLQVQADNTLRATISGYIDPRNLMTPYIKRNAVNDALKYLHSSLGSDAELRRNLDRLWKTAFDSKFSRDSLAKIKSQYLGRARASLPSAIRKARAEALKDLAPRKVEEREEEIVEQETPRKRGPVTPGRPSQPKGKNEMKKGESVAEFFARDN